MATINLGAIRYNWKGAWSNSTAYVINDVVSNGGNSYVAIQAGTNQAVGNATAYWNIMSSAGTNGTDGTDVGTTLTTQGDLLYRDGSGLQRLAKGTASKVLAMNSGATAPEWVDASGGCWEKLNTITISSTTSQIEHEEANFTSTHKDYKIMLSNITITADARMHMRIGADGTTTLSGAEYRYASIGRKSNGATETQGSAGDTSFFVGCTNMGTSTAVFTQNFEINLYNPLSTDSYLNIYAHGHHTDDNDYTTTFQMAGTHTSAQATAMKRFVFYMASGDFSSGTSTLYGRKI